MKRLVLLLPCLLCMGSICGQVLRVGGEIEQKSFQAGIGINLTRGITPDNLSWEVCFGISTNDLVFLHTDIYYYPLPWLYGRALAQPHIRTHGVNHQINGDYMYSWLTTGLGVGAKIPLGEKFGLYAELMGIKEIPIGYHFAEDMENKSYRLINVGLEWKIM